MPVSPPKLPQDISRQVAEALTEDLGSGDVTAQLIAEKRSDEAIILCREPLVFCGRAWVDEVYTQLGGGVRIDWQTQDGEQCAANAVLARLEGPTRELLTGERLALNFLQLLSAVATNVRRHQGLIRHTKARLLDTRKTIPGLRSAQKYAVRCGGGSNHRMGLYDAFLIKENHIAACGGIASAIALARELSPDLKLEIEVQTLAELREALRAQPDIIMLDNFSLSQMREAVAISSGHPLEASGGIDESNLAAVAETGVDFISVGALTKNVRAVDLSLLIQRPADSETR